MSLHVKFSSNSQYKKIDLVSVWFSDVTLEEIFFMKTLLSFGCRPTNLF